MLIALSMSFIMHYSLGFLSDFFYKTFLIVLVSCG